ncbi:T9SS type A sorting domain-containing protein [uncultured Algibacter sp.]|uniref:T9SS type A sorting domain-containing protein n=1 Tax=uncultured Algibacter sp. TaxID=298659 RepID=UPI003216BB38
MFTTIAKPLITSILLFLTAHISCFATVFKVGSTRVYKTPNALYSANIVQDGDTIEIDAETYTGLDCLAVWENNNLIIKGVGGRPHLIADGMNILGKGIWVCAGDNITVENIEFSGAVVLDKNGAGIRLDGAGLTVKQCYFHDNENGILTGNAPMSDILVEFTEFANNGFGDGFSHNIYVNRINRLTFRYNYSHHAKVGHNLKSRARENIIMYNRIMDEDTGNSSRLIDLPNGGFSIIMGNLLMQGENAINENLVGFGLEGFIYIFNALYVVNNTMVNKRATSSVFLDTDSGTNTLDVRNNIFAGTGTVLNGATATNMANNFIDPIIANAGFINEANYDYKLTSSSPAIDNGLTTMQSVSGFSLTPEFHYEHKTMSGVRTNNNDIDIGSYEFDSALSTVDFTFNDAKLYPNPFKDVLNIESNKLNIKNLKVFNVLGQDFTDKITVKPFQSRMQIDTSNLSQGVYFVSFRGRTHRVLKKV